MATGWSANRSSDSLTNELRVLAKPRQALVSSVSMKQQVGAFLVRVSPLLEGEPCPRGVTSLFRRSSPRPDYAPGSRSGLAFHNEPVGTREWRELAHRVRLGYALNLASAFLLSLLNFLGFTAEAILRIRHECNTPRQREEVQH